MAGDWIPMRVALRETHQVFSISEATGLEVDTVVGKLLRLWGWFDQHTENGNAPVTLVYADRVAECAGFAQAMQKVGWLTIENGVMSVTEFDKYFSQGGKRRLLTARRVAHFRKRSCNAPALPTQPQPQPQQKIPTVSKRGSTFKPPTLDEVRAYFAEKQTRIDPEQFFAHYDANGWRQANGNTLKNWKSALVTWEKNDHQRKGTHASRNSIPAGPGQKFDPNRPLGKF